MNKRKINPKRKEKTCTDVLEERLNDAGLTFMPLNEVREYEHDIRFSGYEPAVIEVLGNEVGIVMKQELKGALMDPSDDDVDILTSARDSYKDFALENYGEKAKIPAETSFGRFVEDSLINSLVMNIFKFPTDKLNLNKLKKYGLDQEDVVKLADKAYKVYCETADSLNLGGGMDSLDSIGGSRSSKNYSGNSNSVDLSSDVCEAGSHYKLNMKVEKLQKEVQKEMPVFSDEYQQLENKAVKRMLKYNPALTEHTAVNMFRMFLNLGGVYGKGKALPIK